MTLRRADYCCIAMAEIYRGDGEILANPTVGTIPFVGARLARATFEPDLVITDGEAMLVAGLLPLGANGNGKLIEGWLPYRNSFDVVWSGRRHVVMGASQIDRYGNQNITCIGPWQKPLAQLIGARGAPGNTVNHAVSYWVPKHSARVFVPVVDFVSGIGPRRARDLGGVAGSRNDIRAVVTDLGVFDFDGADCSMRARFLHPGVTPEEVSGRSDFPVEFPSDVSETRAPTPEEARLLAEIDPRGLRYSEVP
jgi:acyl CoA:acetate/3-ketoacid CoA transferase beta subunit